MTLKYEYIRIPANLDDLEKLNTLASDGWRVVLGNKVYLLLERLITEKTKERKT